MNILFMCTYRLILILITILLFSFNIYSRVNDKGVDKKNVNSKIIHWYAPFLSGGGYCSEAFSFIFALKKQKIKTIISHHGDTPSDNFINGLSKIESQLIDSHMRYEYPPAITICHSEPGAWHVPRPMYNTERCPPKNARYKIGRTMFETDRIPDGWPKRLNAMDEIWVPSEFAREIFFENGVEEDKLVVIGEPVDTNFYSPIMKKQRNNTNFSIPLPSSLSMIPNDKFLFLFVGKWETRKGLEILLRAFMKEFDSVELERVHLVILTSAYHSTNQFTNEIEVFLNKESLIPESCSLSWNISSYMTIVTDIPQKDMPALYSYVHTLVR